MMDDLGAMVDLGISYELCEIGVEIKCLEYDRIVMD